MDPAASGSFSPFEAACARRARMTAPTDSCDSLMELYRPPEDPPHLPRTSSGFSFDVGLQLSFDEELVSLQLS